MDNLKGRAYIDLTTNAVVTVVDEFKNVVTLNDQRNMRRDRLEDPAYFRPHDQLLTETTNMYTNNDEVPLNMFDVGSALNQALRSQINTIDTHGVQDTGDQSRPHTNITILDSPFDKGAPIIAPQTMDVDAYINQQAQLSREQAMKQMGGGAINPYPNETVTEGYPQQPYYSTEQQQPRQVEEDPIVKMFNKTKRNTPFKVELPFEDKLPSAEFMRLMEDSYEESIVEHFTNVFFKKIMEDPTVFKDRIRDEIKIAIYGSIKPKKTPTKRKPAADQ
jgi:hypothetical protein